MHWGEKEKKNLQFLDDFTESVVTFLPDSLRSHFQNDV